MGMHERCAKRARRHGGIASATMEVQRATEQDGGGVGGWWCRTVGPPCLPAPYSLPGMGPAARITPGTGT